MYRSLLVASLAVAICASSAALAAPSSPVVTWLSTSRIVCPTGQVSRGISSTCTAYVDYPNAGYILAASEVAVHHDACTHVASCLPSTYATDPATSTCLATGSQYQCTYSFTFSPPTAITAGGTFTVSLARKAIVADRVPETLIAQTTIYAAAPRTASIAIAAAVLLVSIAVAMF